MREWKTAMYNAAKSLIFLALIILMICQGSAYSSVAWRDSSTFTHCYEGDVYPIPRYHEGSGTPAVPITSNAGILSYTTSSTEDKYWEATDWSKDVPVKSGFTIEARIKLYSTSPIGPSGGFVIYAGHGVSADMAYISIYANKIIVYGPGSDTYNRSISTGDNTNAFHTFQISAEPTSGKINIWRDAVQIATDLPPLDRWEGNTLYWGDGSLAEYGKVDIDYVRWDLIPSSIASTVSDYNHYEGDVYPVPFYTEGGNTLSPPASQSGGVLSYTTNANQSKYWTSTEWPNHVTASSGYTIEAKLKIKSTSPTGTEGVFVLYSGDGTKAGMASLNIFKDKVVARQWAAGGVWNFQNIYTGDNTDAFHVFRISTAAGSGKFQIWRDDVRMATDVGALNNWADTLFYFGDGSGTVYGGVDIDYIRWDTLPTGTLKYSDDVTVDGYLTDWAVADWRPFEKTYDGNPAGTSDGSAWAVKWGVGGTKIYLAVKIYDPANVFVDANAPLDPGDTNSKGRREGSWVYYETVTTPYEYFGARNGVPGMAAVLNAADVIAADVVVTSHATASGTVQSGFVGYCSPSSQLELGRNGVKGYVTLQDYGTSVLLAPVKIVITNAVNVSETHNLVLDETGAYSFNTVLSGACTATASAVGYVPQTLPVTVISGNGDVSFTLVKKVVNDTSIAGAKKLPLGSYVTFTGSITAAFGDSIYVETSDRVAGIKVYKVTSGFTSSDVGRVVKVTGDTAKDAASEIYIIADLIDPTGVTNTLEPLGLTNESAGGGDFVDALGNGQVGVSGGKGVNNIGLLVRTTGLASAGDANGFTMTDGSGVTLKVSFSGAGTTYNGKYVTVTGISSLASSGLRVIKARTVGDIEIVR